MDHPDQAAAEPLAYINPQLPTFHLLNKVLSFDDAQQAVYTLPPPCIVIGSGSGKTLTLEKMKDAPGEVLYVTRSPYLVHNARTLYYALGMKTTTRTSVSCRSRNTSRACVCRKAGRWGFGTLPSGLPATAPRALKDPHALFEEFQGVLTGPSTDTPT